MDAINQIFGLDNKLAPFKAPVKPVEAKQEVNPEVAMILKRLDALETLMKSRREYEFTIDRKGGVISGITATEV